ncbi:hypothetical protein [Streptomyces sp. NPDC050422]|uniref:hypothetical protein n=1 Tax=Streptomyces sp. NPDC050422 TaxID=3365614 RepID=UPI0037A841E7
MYQARAPRQSADNAHSYLWPLREAAAATVDMAGLPGMNSVTSRRLTRAASGIARIE